MDKNYKISVITSVIDGLNKEHVNLIKNVDFVGYEKIIDNSKTFNNCSYVLKLSNEKLSLNLKIFTNGRIQITGAKDEKEIVQIVDNIKKCISKDISKDISYKISMYNVHHKYKTVVNLEKLKTYILENKTNFENPIYRSSRYHGFKMSHINGTKFLIYSTGTIIVINNNILKIEESLNELLCVLSCVK